MVDLQTRRRRTGATYKITDCIKDLYRVVSICVICDGLNHVESGVDRTFGFCYVVGERDSAVNNDPEIFIVVDSV